MITLILLYANVLVLTAACAVLFLNPSASAWYRIAMIGSTGVVLLAAFLTFRRRSVPDGLRLRSLPVAATVLAVLPWIALTVTIASEGLWWTQRPVALRFFVVYMLANWSFFWCVSGAPAVLPRGPQRVLSIFALVLAALGIQGSAFGLTPFGCAVSAAFAGAAALLFAVACRYGRAASLKLLAATLASLLAAAAVEIVARVLGLGQNVREVDNRQYARQFYSMTPPNAAFVNPPKALDEFDPALISTNSLGIRGPELAEPRADLLLIGDSMVEARQLPWEQTIGPQLQEALRARDSSLRVVAHGMRGWSPLLEWNWYLKVGRQLRPRVVLLFFFWNDLWIEGDEAVAFRAKLDSDGRPQYFDVAVDANWIWYKNVRLVRISEDVLKRLSVREVTRAFATAAGSSRSGTLEDHAADRLARTLTDRPLSEHELDAVLTSPATELSPDLRVLAGDDFWPRVRPLRLWPDAQRAAAARTEDRLRRFADDVTADGGRLAIVYVPNPMQVGPQECSVGRLFSRVERGVVLPADSGLQEWLRGVSSRHGIELLDPTRAMREYSAQHPPSATGRLEPLYLRADCHWSPRGHRLMAEYLAGWAIGAVQGEGASGRGW